MRISEIQYRILVKTTDQFFADITAGGEVLFDRGSDDTGPQRDAAGSKLTDQYFSRFRLGLFC